MYCNVEQWIEIRRRVLTGEISRRQACREYALHWQTLKRILSQPVPPERRDPGPPRPSKLDRFRPALTAMLDADRQSHRKQRHTAWRIFERLRDEHGYDGGYTLVKDAVRELKLSRKEVFLPLRHDPGEAQVDFGYCYVDLAGQRQQVVMFVLSLPYCDTVYCQNCVLACLECNTRKADRTPTEAHMPLTKAPVRPMWRPLYARHGTRIQVSQRGVLDRGIG